MTPSSPETANIFIFVATAAAALAIWLLAKAAAPMLQILRMVTSAALAFVALGVALAFIAVVLVSQ